jgi:hypothetical protein
MKKFTVILMCLAACGLVLGACGDDDGGPKCVKAWTLIPCATEASPTGCADPATKECCNGSCVDRASCEPACEITTHYCSCGACVAFPATCDPACPTGKYCDNGTCRDNPTVPVCNPVCAADEVCVN